MTTQLNIAKVPNTLFRVSLTTSVQAQIIAKIHSAISNKTTFRSVITWRYLIWSRKARYLSKAIAVDVKKETVPITAAMMRNGLHSKQYSEGFLNTTARFKASFSGMTRTATPRSDSTKLYRRAFDGGCKVRHLLNAARIPIFPRVAVARIRLLAILTM